MTAAVVMIRQNRIIEAYRDVGATTPAAAVDPATLDVRKSLPFRALVRRGVLRESEAGRYYLVEREVPLLRARRRMVLGIFMMLGAVGVALALLL